MRFQRTSVVLISTIALVTQVQSQFSSLAGNNNNRKKLTLKNFGDGKNGNNNQNGFIGQQAEIDYRKVSNRIFLKILF